MTEESESLFSATFPSAGPLPAWLTPSGGAPSRKKNPGQGIEDATLTYLLMQRRAMDLFKDGRFAEARAAFDGLLAIDPEEVNWLFMKGLCLLELGDYQAVLVPISAAERLAPWDPDVLLIKADALLELGEYAQAQQALSKLFILDPEHSRGRYRLACWAALTGQPRRALKELRRLIDEDSGFREEAAKEPAFAGLHGLPEFRKLVAAQPQPE